MNALRREWLLVRRDRGALLWLAVTFLAACFAVISGLQEVDRQHREIDALREADAADRSATLATQADWGSAAYYAFHLTYAEPDSASFLTQGEREHFPWKHRVRMLALEGQIYEADVSSPTIALLGRFDVAFLIAILLPLLLIAMLYDLRAAEADAGRYEILEATAGADSFWRTRGLLKAALLTLALWVPTLVGAIVSGAGFMTIVTLTALLFFHAAFWTWVILTIAAWRRPTPVLLASLVGCWLLLTIMVPLVGKLAIERSVDIPPLAELALEQRETVNDAWDLPKATTMDAFVAEHPAWADQATIGSAFEWKWYYAFQQVGDQTVEPLSKAYRDGLLQRERYLDRLAWLTPPMLVTRQLKRLAGADLRAMLAYQERIREFHQRLREFHYPKLFRDEPFSPEAAEALPSFAAVAREKTPGDS